MRLWHWRLIPVLPRQQLLSQWRECCAIAKSINEKGTPNHILVNPIMNYPISDLDKYTRWIGEEMMCRGYNWNFHRYTDHRPGLVVRDFISSDPDPYIDLIFHGWHNDQYFWQCYSTLQEKHDRGGITDEEWSLIEKAARLVPSA